MQICKKRVLCVLILFFSITLFAQLSVPSVSAPTISSPIAPTVPTMGTSTPGMTTTTTSSSSSTKSTESTKTNEESSAGMDLTSDALSALSGLFGADTSMLGTDSMTDIYSLLETDLTADQNGVVDNLLLEQILTKLDTIEATLETTNSSVTSNNVLTFNIVNSKTSEVSNLLAKSKNISFSNKNTNGNFLLSGTIVHNSKNNSENETFYMDFKLLNTHTYEVNFTVHSNNEKSILKEMASHGPYKASKTANYVTMSIFGPEYYLDLVFSID